MAKKNTGAIVAGVVGIGALGLGAVMLSQQKTGNNKETTSLFSGVSGTDSGYIGGGMTGGYAETVTPSVSDTVGEVLTEVLTQTQTPQPVFIMAQPEAQDAIIPQIQEIDNPSDEDSDIKQGAEGVRRGESVIIPDSAGNAYEAFYSALVQEDRAFESDGGVYTASKIGSGAKTSTSSAVEYNPNDAYTFQPTPKQADVSSYNQSKTGGTANTPSKAEREFESNKVYDSGSKTPTTPAKAPTTPTTPAKAPTTPTTSAKTPTTPTTSGSYMPVTSPVQTALNAFSSAVGAVANNFGSFLSGIFGR